MAIVDGWLDWAVRHPGPANKVYVTPNEQRGLVCHSAEGYNPSNFHELDRPDRAASWHCTNSLDGTFYQHYPFSASCWASGNYEANTRFVAVESEGVVGVDGPLNTLQVDNMLRLVHDLPFFPVRKSTLWEHNEVATMWAPNAGPTSCPSHRYDPFFAALEDDFMSLLTPDQQRKLLLRLFAGSEFPGDTDQQKLDRAIAEIDAGGTVQSLNDVSLSAIAVALDAHPGIDTSAAVQARVKTALENAAKDL